MLLALVVGTATTTVRHRSVKNFKLLVVQPMLNDGRSPDGSPLLAVDLVGSGQGDRVMISSDGRSIKEALGDRNTPVRWTVVGIQD